MTDEAPTEAPAVTETATDPPTPEEIVGVPNGSEVVIKNPDGTETQTGEKAVYEYDEAGTFVGWHKEAMA